MYVPVEANRFHPRMQRAASRWKLSHVAVAAAVPVAAAAVAGMVAAAAVAAAASVVYVVNPHLHAGPAEELGMSPPGFVPPDPCFRPVCRYSGQAS